MKERLVLDLVSKPNSSVLQPVKNTVRYRRVFAEVSVIFPGPALEKQPRSVFGKAVHACLCMY